MRMRRRRQENLSMAMVLTLMTATALMALTLMAPTMMVMAATATNDIQDSTSAMQAAQAKSAAPMNSDGTTTMANMVQMTISDNGAAIQTANFTVSDNTQAITTKMKPSAGTSGQVASISENTLLAFQPRIESNSRVRTIRLLWHSADPTDKTSMVANSSVAIAI